MANTFITRTPSSTTDTQRKQFTISMWVKRSSLGTGGGHQEVVSAYSTDQFGFRFDGNNKLDIFEYSVSGNTYPLRLTTNRLFRDVNAWYHIVLQVDTPNATSSNRAKLYINGVQETSFATANYPSQDLTLTWNKNGLHQIASKAWGNSGNGENFFDGLISHFHNIAGTAYDASAFGETDATTGEWKIKTSPSVTYGTNGFFILKDSGSVTDQSGNSNNFTVAGGTLTNTEDSPSNVFATLNAIQESPANNSLSNGNTTSTNDGSASGHKLRVATLGASSGKYYAEFKLPNGGSNYAWCGIISYDDFNNPDTYMGSSQNSISYGSGGTVIRNDSTLSSQGEFSAIGSSTILQVAVDLDNNYIYFGIDGTYVNSGNPTSGGSGTGGYSINFSAGKTYTFGVSGNNTGATWNCNFGNGYFGTTAVSSAGTNASGIGIFEYDVPTGFTALSTKGLNL